MKRRKHTTCVMTELADKKMVSRLKKARKSGQDNIFNTTMGIAPIRLKMIAENIGLIKKGSFGNIEKGVEKDNIQLNKSELARLERLGYGKKPNKKNPWLAHVAKVRADHPKGTPYSECLKIASRTYKKKK